MRSDQPCPLDLHGRQVEWKGVAASLIVPHMSDSISPTMASGMAMPIISP